MMRDDMKLGVPGFLLSFQLRNAGHRRHHGNRTKKAIPIFPLSTRMTSISIPKAITNIPVG